jgi:hypothetical protein
MKKIAIIRKDLQTKNIAVPVGDKYYSGNKPLPYRWKNNDDVFQVKMGGKWEEAQSIDFDFPLFKQFSGI